MINQTNFLDAPSIAKIKTLASEKKNYVEAFSHATFYKSSYLEKYKKDTTGTGRMHVSKMNVEATEWLAYALEFKKNNGVDLKNYINLDDFFDSLEHLRRKILNCDANHSDKKLILNALLKNKTITTLIIEREEDLSDFVMELLKGTGSIKEIIVSMKSPTLTPQFITKLVEVLKLNSSLQEVDFGNGNPMSTGDFKVILDALAMNPNSKLKVLSGQRITVNPERAQLLINHLKNDHQLTGVQPYQIKNNTIEMLIIERYEELNDFIKLLKSTPSITKVIVKLPDSVISPFIKELAQVLKSNSSLQAIDFGDGGYMSTGDFKAMLDALALNPDSKLTTLGGQRSTVHRVGQFELFVKHLKNHRPLTIDLLALNSEADLYGFGLELLKSTKSIKKIKLNVYDSIGSLSYQFIYQLAEVLKSNSSIQEIDFGDGVGYLSFDKFKVILDALALNPNSKLRVLTGKNITVHNPEIAELLIKHLQKNHQIMSVPTRHNQAIGNDNFNTLFRAFESNKHLENVRHKAVRTGAARGFFGQLNHDKNLAQVMGPYLSIATANSLSRVSKLISKEVKNELEKTDSPTPKGP